MRTLLSTSLATAVALLLAANVHADDLVLELVTKFKVKKTVDVVSVDPGDERGIGSLFPGGTGWRRDLPERLARADKKYLALSVSSTTKANYPAMLIAIPWDSIKEIQGQKLISTVTCEDGAKFTGNILTEVTDSDNKKEHLASSGKVTVKKVTKFEETKYTGPVATCSVRFNDLDQSFKGRGLGYKTTGKFTENTSQKFEMKVDGQINSANLSDFEKVVVKGREFGPIQIAVQAPKEKEIDGELGWNQNSALIFEAANGSFVVLWMRQNAAGIRQPPASFTATIESTKKGESLPPELFPRPLPKK